MPLASRSVYCLGFRCSGARVCALVLLSLISALPLHADDYYEVQRYSVRMFSYGTLTVNTRVGDIDIAGWDRPRLSIKAEKLVTAGSRKKAERMYGRIHVELAGSDHQIRLSTRYPSRRPWRPFRGESRLSVNFTIRMPYDSNLRLKCVDGDVTVSGLTGHIRLDDNYGDIEIDVPSVYRLRLLDAHSWLGYVQSDLHGLPNDETGFGRTLDFRNPNGSQIIVVRVRMGGVWVYGEGD